MIVQLKKIGNNLNQLTRKSMIDRTAVLSVILSRRIGLFKCHNTVRCVFMHLLTEKLQKIRQLITVEIGPLLAHRRRLAAVGQFLIQFGAAPFTS